jgi:hypothetical protein
MGQRKLVNRPPHARKKKATRKTETSKKGQEDKPQYKPLMDADWDCIEAHGNAYWDAHWAERRIVMG